jgi:phage tail sheath protein FI
MANFSISPGVTISEIDNTFLTGQPVQAGAAIIGPTVKGPVNVPTLITSYSDYQNYFGDTFTSGGLACSYFTSLAAYNYFNYGGSSLIVTRVVSGSYTSATSSLVTNDIQYVVGDYVVDGYVGANIFELETISEGVIMNNNITGSAGALLSGTKDNVRFEILTPNTSSGTFTLLVRRGDDRTNQKLILETWNNISLDPYSSRYISKVIGDQKLVYDPANEQIDVTGEYPNQSRYIRVAAVNNPTPNYLDANGQPKPQYTGSIPAAQNGTFGGAIGDVIDGANLYENITFDNTQGVNPADYDDAINILKNRDAYQFNVLFTPGLTNDLHNSTISTLIQNTQDRGDNLFVLDLVTYDRNVAEAIDQANSRDTSYAASYYPWVRVIDPSTGRQIWTPASTVIPGVYAFNDKVAAPWFAPAGINRGGLNTVIRAQYKLTQANKDDLYESNVNPLASLPKEGVVVFGQKTLQKEASALDRVNVRRLMIELKNYIRQIADTVVFEQNTNATRNAFLAKVTPYLQIIQQKQGLYAFKVVMDDSNNGPDVIDRNQLIGQIYVQPTKTAEFISLDFILLPTGAQFPV